MSVMECFAKRLSELRKEEGISQEQLGKTIGVSRGSISFYEAGVRTPDIETLDKISKYFDVSIEYLLGYVNSKGNIYAAFENITGIDEDTIRVFEDVMQRESKEVVEVMNEFIQDDWFVELCRDIAKYRQTRFLNPLQFCIMEYISNYAQCHNPDNSFVDFETWVEVTKPKITNDEFKQANDFVNRFIDDIQKYEKYTGIYILDSNMFSADGILELAKETLDEIVKTIANKKRGD